MHEGIFNDVDATKVSIAEIDTCFEKMKDSMLNQLGDHAFNLSLKKFVHLEKTLSAKDITEEQKFGIVEQMMDLV